MAAPRALVQSVLCICAAAQLAAQQPGSVTSPAPPKPAVSPGMTPIGIMVDQIVAVVGQKPILLSEVMDAIFYMKGAGSPVPDPSDTAHFNAFARDTVLSDMIDQEVLVAVAKQYKSEVDDKEITPDVDKRLKELHGRFKSDAEFRTQLKAEGFGTETDLRNSLLDRRRRDMLQQMAMDSLKAHGKLAAPVNVSEADVTAAFEREKSRIGKRPSTISFKQIIVAPKANAAARAAAKAKADSLLAVIEKGGDFETIAKKESMDPDHEGPGWRAAVRAARQDGGGVRPRAVLRDSPGHGRAGRDRVAVRLPHHPHRPRAARGGEVEPHPDHSEARFERRRAGAARRRHRDPEVAHRHALRHAREVLPRPRRGAQRTGWLPRGLPAAGVSCRGGGREEGAALAAVRDPESADRASRSSGSSSSPTAMDGGDYTVADVRDKIREQLVQERQFRRMLDQLRREQFVKITM